jgi:hypothetical protein
LEVAHLITNRQLDSWVEAGQPLNVPLDGIDEFSVREIAARHLGISGDFSVNQDIFAVPQIVGTQSLRAKLEVIMR